MSKRKQHARKLKAKVALVALKGSKRCASPVVSACREFGHAVLQSSLQKAGDGAPKRAPDGGARVEGSVADRGP